MYERNVLVQFPSGKWGFVGSVDFQLARVLDGEEIRNDKLDQALNLYSVGSRRLKTRVFQSNEEALKVKEIHEQQQQL